MPVLCLTIDNGPRLPLLFQRAEEVGVLLWLFPHGVTSERVRISAASCSTFYSFHRCFVSSSRLGPRQRAMVLSFLTVNHVARGVCSVGVCVCGQDGGQRLRSPCGSGQQPWQEKANGLFGC